MYEKIISDYRDIINKKLIEVYKKGPSGLVVPINYVLSGKGKRLRPLLTIFSAESFGGSFSKAIHSAIAVEILHNFTLVHDDIMDEDSTRHGKATVHHKWDIGTAILTGDAMLSLALKTIQQSNLKYKLLMNCFVQGLLSVCEGQALDKEFEDKNNVTIDEYINMIDLKTGHLIGLAAEMGAISTDAEKEKIKAVRDYGRLIGRAFQIQDDLLEIFSNSKNMGKSLKSDLLLGKKTYLMILAKQFFPNRLKSALELASKDYSQGLTKIRYLLKTEGIEQMTLEYINKIIDRADRILDNLDIEKSKLHFFSKMITNRGN